MGKRGGHKSRRLDHLNVFLDGVKPEDVKDIFSALTKKAKEGNIQALSLFLSYYLFKPDDRESTEPEKMASSGMSDEALIQVARIISEDKKSNE